MFTCAFLKSQDNFTFRHLAPSLPTPHQLHEEGLKPFEVSDTWTRQHCSAGNYFPVILVSVLLFSAVQFGLVQKYHWRRNKQKPRERFIFCLDPQFLSVPKAQTRLNQRQELSFGLSDLTSKGCSAGLLLEKRAEHPSVSPVWWNPLVRMGQGR